MFRIVLIICTILTLSISAQTPLDLNKPYYTQVNMWEINGVWRSVNYIKGNPIPINSKVSVIEITQEHILIVIEETGLEVKLINDPEHSGLSSKQLFKKLFNTEKIDLGPFAEDIVDGPLHWKIQVGMTKEDVIKAVGYPPKHATPSTKTNSWLYWTSKFNKIRVLFRGDKVISVQN